MVTDKDWILDKMTSEDVNEKINLWGKSRSNVVANYLKTGVKTFQTGTTANSKVLGWASDLSEEEQCRLG